jgi:hypothetical protein
MIPRIGRKYSRKVEINVTYKLTLNPARTGTSFAEGCLNWSPYASWMDVVQDRDAWRIAMSTLLHNNEY